MNVYRILTSSGDEELVTAPDLATARQLALGLGEDIEAVVAVGIDSDSENPDDLEDSEDDEELGQGENPDEDEKPDESDESDESD